MKLSDEQLLLIEEYAGLFLSPKEICFMLSFPMEYFLDELQDKQSALHQAYFRGKITSKIELRKKIVPLAKMGSPQAQSLTEVFIRDQIREEFLDE